MQRQRQSGPVTWAGSNRGATRLRAGVTRKAGGTPGQISIAGGGMTMAKFAGYYAGWDRCSQCGLKLVRTGATLKHRRGQLAAHKLVVQKKAHHRALAHHDLGIDLARDAWRKGFTLEQRVRLDLQADYVNYRSAEVTR